MQSKAIFKGKTITKTQRGFEVNGRNYGSLEAATASIK